MDSSSGLSLALAFCFWLAYANCSQGRPRTRAYHNGTDKEKGGFYLPYL